MNEFIQLGKVAALCDGQFGSTGKGLLAAYLAETARYQADVATTNASANAGHTTKYRDGRGFVTYHLPTIGVVQEKPFIYLNSGSVIDPQLLIKEINDIGVDPRKIVISPNAAMITDHDKSVEKIATEHVSSTQKGVGSALSRKVMRVYDSIIGNNLDHADVFTLKNMGVTIGKVDTTGILRSGGSVTLEVPQGFSLGINSDFFPYCTSRECTVGSGMADLGVHPSYLGTVAMAVRTYPIRVGSLPGSYSGPAYPDQKETSWEVLGLEPEFTTVTKRMRRVFTFSKIQYEMAFAANRPDIVFVNFCNYMKDHDQYMSEVGTKIEEVHSKYGANPTVLYGFGPNVEDVYAYWSN
jgi:adenylosuccinate synthase